MTIPATSSRSLTSTGTPASGPGILTPRHRGVHLAAVRFGGLIAPRDDRVQVAVEGIDPAQRLSHQFSGADPTGPYSVGEPASSLHAATPATLLLARLAVHRSCDVGGDTMASKPPMRRVLSYTAYTSTLGHSQ